MPNLYNLKSTSVLGTSFCITQSAIRNRHCCIDFSTSNNILNGNNWESNKISLNQIRFPNFCSRNFSFPVIYSRGKHSSYIIAINTAKFLNFYRTDNFCKSFFVKTDVAQKEAGIFINGTPVNAWVVNEVSKFHLVEYMQTTQEAPQGHA